MLTTVFLNRQVAIKTLTGELDPAALEMFKREWSALASLSHPNIVDIIETGEYEEHGFMRPFFVMPLLPGKTLEEIIKTESHRLTVDRVVEIIREACRGLQAAHEKNVIHRDLKPSNIFVLDDDTAKIIDFGVAHLAGSHSTTGLKGTLQYMAPEQLDLSSPLSQRSDIFALAVVCYEALTGRKPFARRTQAETSDAIRLYIPPPASDVNGAVSTMIARTVHKAMAKKPWQRFSSAKEFAETLRKAQRNEPIEFFDSAKIQPRIERAKKAYKEGDDEYALEIVTELESEGHIDPDLPVLRTQVEQSVLQRKVRQLLENARTRVENNDYPLALQKLAEILALDPNNPDALAMQARIERQRTQKQVEQWFRLAEEHRQNRLFGQARQWLQEILKADSSNTRARTMLAEVDQTEQETNRLRDEKKGLYDEAMQFYRNGELSSALSKLERGIELSKRPAAQAVTTDLDSQYQSFYNQVRSERDAVRDAYSEGRKSLDDKNPARTLEICEERLRKQPNDPMFQALKLEAEEMQRLEQSMAIAEMSKRAEAEPDLDKRVGILNEAVERFPNETHFKASIRFVRERRDLVNSIVDRARQYEERGQFSDAQGQWDILRTIHAGYPGLDAEVQRLNARRVELAHAETKARWMQQIDAHFATGEYSKAREAIQAAQAEFPADKDLESLASLAEQGVRRSASAKELLAKGQALCAERKLTEGLDALRQAERLDPRSNTIRATLLSTLVESARELISKDWRAAAPLIQEATALNDTDPVVRSLNSLLESHQRQEAVNGILTEARDLQGSGDIAGALKLVEDGLAKYPNELRLSQIRTTLAAAAPEVKKEVPPPPQPELTEQEAFSATQFAATSLDVATSKPSTPDVDLTRLSPPTLPPPKQQAKKPEKPPVIAGAPSTIQGLLKKPLWQVTALVAATLIAVAILYSTIHKKPTPVAVPPPSVVADVKVQLTANEPGATFKVDGSPVSASTTLKPGEHSGEADLAGFKPDIHSFTVPNGSGPINVAFSLMHVAPQVLFSSGITGGSAIFDDAPPVDLQQGEFDKTDIQPGDHHLRIMQGKHQVLSVSFHVTSGQLIKLTSPLDTSENPGIAISSLGGAAQVYVTAGLKASLSGETPKVVSDSGLAVPAANPPSHVSVAVAGKVRDFVPDNSSQPTLNLILTGGVERVPVTVTANASDGVISIDGEDLKRHIANGAIRFELVPGSYSIVVRQQGFQPVAPQRLLIRAGDDKKQLNFQLNAVVRRAGLELSGAPPEATVFLDDVRAGTINASGGYSKDDVSPGEHTIVIRKSGLDDFKEKREFIAGENVRLPVQMHSSGATFALHVTPANAKITLRGSALEIFTPQGGQSIPIPPGSYKLTAAADGYETKNETIEIEAGHSMSLEWTLTAAQVQTATTPSVPFSNASTWHAENGLLTHTGGGVSVFTGGNGTHTFDIKGQRKGLFHGSKKIIFYADMAGRGDYIQYSLDGHNLSKIVYTNGQASAEQKFAFGQDNDQIRLTVELSANSFIVKNRGGATIDSIHKTNIGRFGFVDDLTLRVVQ